MRAAPRACDAVARSGLPGAAPPGAWPVAAGRRLRRPGDAASAAGQAGSAFLRVVRRFGAASRRRRRVGRRHRGRRSSRAPRRPSCGLVRRFGAAVAASSRRRARRRPRWHRTVGVGLLAGRPTLRRGRIGSRLVGRSRAGRADGLGGGRRGSTSAGPSLRRCRLDGDRLGHGRLGHRLDLAGCSGRLDRRRARRGTTTLRRLGQLGSQHLLELGRNLAPGITRARGTRPLGTIAAAARVAGVLAGIVASLAALALTALALTAAGAPAAATAALDLAFAIADLLATADVRIAVDPAAAAAPAVALAVDRRGVGSSGRRAVRRRGCPGRPVRPAGRGAARRSGTRGSRARRSPRRRRPGRAKPEPRSASRSGSPRRSRTASCAVRAALPGRPRHVVLFVSS